MDKLTPLTVTCIVLKLIGVGLIGATVFVTCNEAKKGLGKAAMPMSILGNMLNVWVMQKKVTTSQLETWWDVRRSFLCNEVTMTLKKYQNIVIGYLCIAVVFIGIEAIRIAILKQDPHMMLLPLSGVFLFLNYSCLQAAMKCDKEQAKHIDLLESLKTSMVGASTEGKRVKEAIAGKVSMLKERDFQTKLVFFPLNPKIITALATYFATAGAAVLYSLFTK